LACVARAAPIAYLLLLALFQVSIVLKLDGHVSWSIWRVAAPWLAIEAIHGLLLTLQLVATILKANEGRAASPTVRQLLVVALDTYWWFLIRVVLAVLVVLRLNHSISWHWALVFAPSYLPAIRSVITLCLLRRQLRAMGDAEVAQNESAIVLASVIAFVIVASFVYSFVALLIWKLSLPSAVRLALVLIPVFIALSILCCLCTCLSCCLACGMHAPLDDERDVESNIYRGFDVVRLSNKRVLGPYPKAWRAAVWKNSGSFRTGNEFIPSAFSVATMESAAVFIASISSLVGTDSSEMASSVSGTGSVVIRIAARCAIMFFRNMGADIHTSYTWLCF
ncbi:hypothetical protein GGI08_004796, partial [Coemansia sp. S2]